MSEAPVQAQARLETQPPLPVQRLPHFICCREQAEGIVYAR